MAIIILIRSFEKTVFVSRDIILLTLTILVYLLKITLKDEL